MVFYYVKTSSSVFFHNCIIFNILLMFFYICLSSPFKAIILFTDRLVYFLFFSVSVPEAFFEFFWKVGDLLALRYIKSNLSLYGRDL